MKTDHNRILSWEIIFQKLSPLFLDQLELLNPCPEELLHANFFPVQKTFSHFIAGMERKLLIFP